MSDRGNAVEWVETTEEVIVTEECLPHVGNTSEVIPVFESSETPIQKLLDTMVQGEDPEFDGFYCEECRSLFQDQSEVNGINGPSFILDSPTTMGVSQRALLTLPHGLMIGRSSIPTAGLGVINHGPTLSPGMHFGPYEGEVTTRENAVASDFSWEIFKGKDEYEYIDAARDTHSNWMRYVNCARNEDEKNLLAVQYKDSVLFHCCCNIHPGDELMVWPSSNLLTRLSEAWTQIWLMKFTPTESNATVVSQIFLCCHCQLSFTTEAYLQRHTDYFHLQHKEDGTVEGPEAVDASRPSPSAKAEDGAAVAAAMDPLAFNACADCGKSFKHAHHLRRHRLCVHGNKRPYCCPQCRRAFSQASGLIRHQLVHRKQSLVKKGVSVSGQSDMRDQVEILPPASEMCDHATPPEAEEVNEVQEVNAGDKLTSTQDRPLVEAQSARERANEAAYTCSECNKSFFKESTLTKHTLAGHSRIRLRPYVCSVCRKCFAQTSDLDKHLKSHQRKKTEVRNSEMQPVGDQNNSATEGGEDHHSDLIAQSAVAETAQPLQTSLYQRPRRLGARSKLSAITKLIAPKRRAQAAKKTAPGPVKPEEACGEPEPADADVSLPESDGTSEQPRSCKRCKVACESPEDLKAHKCITVKHACTQCGATFRKAGFLTRHERMVHLNAKSYTCDCCNRAFSKLGNLKQHQKSKRCEKHHCTSEVFPCPFCQFSFTMKNYLLKHIRRHHSAEYIAQRESDNQMILLEEEVRGKPQVCPTCGKVYVDENHFRSHVCFQQVKIVYLCTDCGKGFPNHHALKQHRRVHTGEKPYSCSHCEKSFAHAGQLTVHLRTHTGEKPYLCTHCGESFRQSGDLKRHEAKHTGVRPHHCSECFKSFSRPQSLKAHQLLHMGQRLFKCTQCGKSFSRNYHLRRHHQKMHT